MAYRRFLCAAFCVTLFVSSPAAVAIICKPVPHYLFVGNDGNCDYSDIQTAINNVVCPDTTVVVTRELTYTNQALTIDNESLTLSAVGDGVPCGTVVVYCDPSLGSCNNPPPTQPLVTIAGGQAGKSVLTITGNSNVTLQYIEITGGKSVFTQRGGGIFFGDTGSGGYGTLTLDTVTIDNNMAQYGGGISFSPSNDGTSGTLSALTLLSNTLILENTAVNDGGGIRIEGSESSLFALQPQILIGYNSTTNGYGGGIVVVGARVADIGSPGYNGGPVLQFNNAQAGGGAIAAFAHGSLGAGFNESLVRVFTTDPQHPVQVSSNSTSGVGGAVYLKGSRACLYNYQVNDNIGVSGAAIYAEIDADLAAESAVDLNPSTACGPNSPTDEGAVACAVPCSQMYGNVAENAASQPTGGSVVGLSGAILTANKLDLRRSIAGDLIEGDGAAYLTNCVLADNHTQHELIGLTTLYVDDCTVANNTIDDSYVISIPSGGEFDFYSSIVDEPANLLLNYLGDISKLKASYLLLFDTSSFPVAGDTIVSAEPTFVDAANGDYHLQATSWGIDYAPLAIAGEIAGVTQDLDGNPRNVDLAQVPDLFGPRDLGAYERQHVCVADTIFCDTFDGYH